MQLRAHVLHGQDCSELVFQLSALQSCIRDSLAKAASPTCPNCRERPLSDIAQLRTNSALLQLLEALAKAPAPAPAAAPTAAPASDAKAESREAVQQLEDAKTHLRTVLQRESSAAAEAEAAIDAEFRQLVAVVQARSQALKDELAHWRQARTARVAETMQSLLKLVTELKSLANEPAKISEKVAAWLVLNHVEAAPPRALFDPRARSKLAHHGQLVFGDSADVVDRKSTRLNSSHT